MKGNTVREKEEVGGGIVKLVIVLALYTFYGSAKLSGNKGEKMGNGGKRVRFEAKRECPQVMGAIIENNNIVFKL